MGKNSSHIVLKKILTSLSKNSKSISEISKETNSDRNSISKYLKILKETNFIIEETKGNTKKFFLSQKQNYNTYFGLPLEEKKEKLVDALYYYIKKEWYKKTKNILSKTTAQKIAYDVVKKENLNIPSGWYSYGPILIKPYDPKKKYEKKYLNKKTIETIKNIVKEYSKNEFSYQSKNLQYKKANKELYNLKEKILKLLYSKNFSKKSMYIFQKLYLKFLLAIPKSEDETYKELINEFDTILMDIIRYWDDFVDEKNEEEFSSFKRKIIVLFESLWKLVALINFKKDLEEYYSEKELEEYFKTDIEKAKEELISIGSEIVSMIPFEEYNNESFLKLKKAIKKINKKVSSKSLEKQNKKLEKIKKEKGLKEYNEELFKLAGLK